jgi:hypothetical protein
MHPQNLYFHYLLIIIIPFGIAKWKHFFENKLFLIVDDIKIDLGVTNPALQTTWKNKDAQHGASSY